jgi:hypothetical protein
VGGGPPRLTADPALWLAYCYRGVNHSTGALVMRVALPEELRSSVSRSSSFFFFFFFFLSDAEQELRACGRHAFRDKPAVAELFADALATPRNGRRKGE